MTELWVSRDEDSECVLLSAVEPIRLGGCRVWNCGGDGDYAIIPPRVANLLNLFVPAGEKRTWPTSRQLNESPADRLAGLYYDAGRCRHETDSHLAQMTIGVAMEALKVASEVAGTGRDEQWRMVCEQSCSPTVKRREVMQENGETHDAG